MKFACMSCGAKYSVPDGRLEDAGSQGLRIRCSRCRAIMVVTESNRIVTPAFATSLRPEDDDTRKELPLKRRPATISSDSLQQQMAAVPSSPDMPAAVSASGVYRPLPGVHRDVTGLWFPNLDELKAEGKSVSSRVWYAAVDSRPRGPFSASEMVSLAERGKIRDSTLVWRPGFSTWKQVRGVELSGTADGPAFQGGPEDLGWLRKIVKARKLRERDAQIRAEQVHGIKPVSLTRTSSGKRTAEPWHNGVGLPPPLPEDAAVDDIPPLAESSGFHWRAEQHHGSASGVRRRQSSILYALAFVALVVGVAAVTGFALKSHAMERFVALLMP